MESDGPSWRDVWDDARRQWNAPSPPKSTFSKYTDWFVLIGLVFTAGVLSWYSAHKGDGFTAFFFVLLGLPPLWLAWELRPPRFEFNEGPLPAYPGAILIRVVVLLIAIGSGLAIMGAVFKTAHPWAALQGGEFGELAAAAAAIAWGGLNLWAGWNIGKGLLFRRVATSPQWDERRTTFYWLGLVVFSVLATLQIFIDTNFVFAGIIGGALLVCSNFLRPGASIPNNAMTGAAFLVLLFLDLVVLASLLNFLSTHGTAAVTWRFIMDGVLLTIYVSTTWKIARVYVAPPPPPSMSGELGNAHLATVAEIEKKTNLIRR